MVQAKFNPIQQSPICITQIIILDSEISYWHHLIMYISSRQKKNLLILIFMVTTQANCIHSIPSAVATPKWTIYFRKLAKTKTYYEHKAIETFLGLL